jgi:hypothetical protein
MCEDAGNSRRSGILPARVWIPMVPATLPRSLWAARTFGTADLGDIRRTTRLVDLAAAIARQPDASLPAALADPATLKAAYRLFANDAVDAGAILAPHAAQTREAATSGTVLLVQDTTTLDFTTHPATTDLGPIAPSHHGHGLFVQTVRADDRVPLGVLGAEAFVRTPAPAGETRLQRTRRDRESDVWGHLAETVGSPPDDTTWVHVADRGGDCYGFFAAVVQARADVLVRTVQNRGVVLADGSRGKVADVLRAQPPAATRPLTVPAHADQPARDTEVAVSWAAMTLQPPTNARRDRSTPPAIPAWGVRVWEPAPPEGAEAVEWRLLTTVPVVTVADAWDRVDWYTARWLIEELHKGLKTGCRIERTQLRERTSIERLLAVLLPVAVRILQWRAISRAQPHAPVGRVADAATVRLVAALSRQAPADTVARFAAQVARLGGYQDRRDDGPPGWQTLWRGWHQVETAQATLDQLGLDLPT